MSVDQWILGALFRPGETYTKAKEQMRFGYWWIIIAVLTLECVMAVHDPATRRETGADPYTITLSMVSEGLFWFYLSSGLLYASARLFGWQPSWLEALKCTGIAWAVIFAEDFATFYWMLRDNYRVLVWLLVPFILWYLVTLTVGVRKVSGLSGLKAALVAAGATLPWRLFVLWAFWRRAY